MRERQISGLKRMWLFISLCFLILPLLRDTTANTASPASSVAHSIPVMFVLSFPSSLFMFPVVLVLRGMLSPFTDTAGDRLTLFGFWAIGAAQWLWIVPGVFRGRGVQTLGLPDGGYDGMLRESQARFFDNDLRSPFERVIHDDAEKDDVRG